MEHIQCAGDFEKRVDAAEVKERLCRYRESEHEITRQIERIERLESKMAGVGAQVPTDLPRAPSPTHDRLAYMMDRKDKLERAVRESIREQSEEWNQIEAVLAQLKNADEKAVIRLRYHDDEEWNEVSWLIFGSKEDYDERCESYLRRTYKVHGRALCSMAAVLTALPDENQEEFDEGKRHSA